MPSHRRVKLTIAATLLFAGVGASIGVRLASAAWTGETIDAQGDAGVRSAITLGPNGALHVLYLRDSPTCPPAPFVPLLVYAAKTSGSWQIDPGPGEPCRPGEHPSIQVDASGSPHILDNRSHGSATRLEYGYRSGGVWVFETLLSAFGGADDPHIAIDAGGVPHAAYGNPQQPRKMIYASRADGVWATEVIDDQGQAGGYSDIVIDDEGNPWISYFRYTGRWIRVATKADGVWTIEDVESSGDLLGCSSIGVDANLTPHLAFARGDGSLAYGTKVDGAWVVISVPLEVGLPHAEVRLQVDSQNRPHILFTDISSGRLQYAFLTSDGWRLSTVGPIEVHSLYGFVLDEDDRAHVTYHTAGSEDLIYATNVVAAGVDDAAQHGDVYGGLRLVLEPNPARGRMRVVATLPRAGALEFASEFSAARLEVLDVVGRRVRTLASVGSDPNSVQFNWDTR